MKLDQIEGNEQLSVGYKRNRQLFAIEMERELVEYLKKSADIFYGLSPAEVRKLVYQLATTHSIEVPLKWSELQQASPDWFTTFLKRRLVLLVQRVSTEKMYVAFLTTLTLSCRGTNFNTVTPGIWTNRSGWMKGGHLLELNKTLCGIHKCSTERPCLLLLDNHKSHLSVSGLNYAEENGIVMLSFPLHCSHRLQPLDHTVYGHLKRHVNTVCDAVC